jgi:hypothetical protein
LPTAMVRPLSSLAKFSFVISNTWLPPIGKPVSRRCARAICTSPSHNRTIATVKMTAPTVSRAIRTSGAAPAVGLGAGKFVGIVRCPTPHLSQFPNESVPIRTVSLAGFGNRVPSERPHVCTLAIFCRLDSSRGTAKSARPNENPARVYRTSLGANTGNFSQRPADLPGTRLRC